MNKVESRQQELFEVTKANLGSLTPIQLKTIALEAKKILKDKMYFHAVNVAQTAIDEGMIVQEGRVWAELASYKKVRKALEGLNT